MVATTTAKKLDAFAALKAVVRLLSQSANAQDFCRRATHAEFFKGMCRGVAIYLLDQRSALVQVAGYGIAAEDPQSEISAWDENFLSTGVRSRNCTYEYAEQAIRVCLPIEVNGVVTGATLFAFSTDYQTSEADGESTRLLSNLVGLFMDNKGVSFGKKPATTVAEVDPDEISVQELTTRQVQILNYVADGLTNAEISKHVLLSESTVRQETIRIFRILKCHTRSEAIVKARANGIIARVPRVSELPGDAAN